MERVITIATADGDFSAYLAEPPAAVAAPVIVVIQEIFGVNADLRETCDNFAAQGYVAICPDLFWRLEPGVDLTDQSEMEWKKARALYAAFDIDHGVADIAATLRMARNLPGVSGKVGVVGFCLGGLLAFLSAVRTDPDAVVAYYGGSTDKYIGEVAQLTRPLLMHLAENDEFINKDAQRIIANTLINNPCAAIHTYRGCVHAFARNGGVHFNALAAKQANDRTLAFLRAHLN